MENKGNNKHSVFACLSFFFATAILIVPLCLTLPQLPMIVRNFQQWSIIRDIFQFWWRMLLIDSLPFIPVGFLLPCVGIAAGVLAIKYGRKAKSTLRIKIAVTGILFNSILLLISLLYVYPSPDMGYFYSFYPELKGQITSPIKGAGGAFSIDPEWFYKFDGSENDTARLVALLKLVPVDEEDDWHWDNCLDPSPSPYYWSWWWWHPRKNTSRLFVGERAEHKICLIQDFKDNVIYLYSR